MMSGKSREGRGTWVGVVADGGWVGGELLTLRRLSENLGTLRVFHRGQVRLGNGHCPNR